MCGIIGIINKKDSITRKTIDMLKQLEYRGYDSSGITVVKNDNFITIKSIGKINNLENKLSEYGDISSNISIAHTRWATHGKVCCENAHPHVSYRDDVAIVHNGIIENYIGLRSFLVNEGYKFTGDTDSEIICNLVSYNLMKSNNVEEAFTKSVKQLCGSYAIALIYKSDPDKLFVTKNGAPLVVGIGENENYISSSTVAFSGITDKIITLEDGEVGIIGSSNVEFYSTDGLKIPKKVEQIKIDDFNTDKGSFEHYMLKEIYEQPDVLRKTISEYINTKNNDILLPKFNFDLSSINSLTIVACGTSYHAGCIAKYFIEDMIGASVNVDIASEFRYRKSPLNDGGLAIFISQSGETADTIAALNYCKEKKQNILSVVNVTHSTIANLSDVVLKTMAGTEIGVASTKAFTAQVSLLYLFTLEIAKQKNKITIDEYHKLVRDFTESVRVLEESLYKDRVAEIKKVAQKLAKTKHIIYIGRNLLYPIALEGALKIKEVSYIPTDGVASGELKHGTIALIDNKTFVIALNNSNLLYDKNTSSIEEVLARKGKVVVIGDKAENKKQLFAFLQIPETRNKFEVVLSTIIPVQLLAYYTSITKEIDVDKPRNLAKSVTVE